MWKSVKGYRLGHYLRYRCNMCEYVETFSKENQRKSRVKISKTIEILHTHSLLKKIWMCEFANWPMCGACVRLFFARMHRTNICVITPIICGWNRMRDVENVFFTLKKERECHESNNCGCIFFISFCLVCPTRIVKLNSKWHVDRRSWLVIIFRGKKLIALEFSSLCGRCCCLVLGFNYSSYVKWCVWRWHKSGKKQQCAWEGQGKHEWVDE